PLERGRKHRVAIRVIMMPRDFSRLLPPPWLQMIAKSGIHKTITVDLVELSNILFSAARARHQASTPGLPRVIEGNPSAAYAPRAPIELCERADTHRENGRRN